jgi:hypothetical protein
MTEDAAKEQVPQMEEMYKILFRDTVQQGHFKNVRCFSFAAHARKSAQEAVKQLGAYSQENHDAYEELAERSFIHWIGDILDNNP